MRSAAISKFLQERIDDGDFPSSVYLVAQKGEIIFADALGHSVVEPEKITATLDTIYDLASLTKVLVTGLLAAILIEKDILSLKESISSFLPEFDRNKMREITIENLLVHNSGFTGWLPFYLLTNEAKTITKAISEADLEYQVGKDVVYSDLNFILLGRIIEIITQMPLAQAYGKFVLNELQNISNRSSFQPLRDHSPEMIAASEKGNGFEKQTCIEKGYMTKGDQAAERHFRQSVIWGEVHDGNAWFMGGVSGHAGLFSTAEDVFKLALQFLPQFTTLLRPETCELFRKNFTPNAREHRSVAFQLATTPESTAGENMSPQSYGHLGFTGTSLWIDPMEERIFILLTNRTHHHELPFVNINSVRRRFHDLALFELSQGF